MSLENKPINPAIEVEIASTLLNAAQKAWDTRDKSLLHDISGLGYATQVNARTQLDFTSINELIGYIHDDFVGRSNDWVLEQIPKEFKRLNDELEVLRKRLERRTRLL